VKFALCLAVACAFSVARAADRSPSATVRWAEGAPNCSVHAGQDGHVNYSLASGNFDVTLSIDRQELEKSQHRAIPVLGVLLTFHYKGTGHFEVQQNRFTLEFQKHFQVVQSSLGPDVMLQRLQQNIDDLTDEVEKHQIAKHPDQKKTKEAELQARLKDYTEMMDFVSTHALKAGLLDGSNSTVSGWVFFSTRNKWIGGWRRPEQFILRLPIEDLMVEFPFQLPPKEGQIELRRRDQ
jgi:hypothetical protein